METRAFFDYNLNDKYIEWLYGRLNESCYQVNRGKGERENGAAEVEVPLKKKKRRKRFVQFIGIY